MKSTSRYHRFESIIAASFVAAVPFATAADAVPAGKDAVPAGKDAVPAGTGDVPAGKEAVPAGKESVPAGKDAEPIGEQTAVPQTPLPAADNAADGLFEERWATVRPQMISGLRSTALSDGTAVEPSADELAWRGTVVAAARESAPPDLFDDGWWETHGGRIAPSDGGVPYAKTRPAEAWWGTTGWAELRTLSGIGDEAEPIHYRPGENIGFDEESMLIGGEAIASRDDLVWSARELAKSGAGNRGRDAGWVPLGTFVLSPGPGDDSAPQAVQLAIDDQGHIDGTYANWPQGRVHPIYGKVDPESQRVAFTIDGNTRVTVDTGLYNLTLPGSRVMVHHPDRSTEVWLLARLTKEVADGENAD